MNIKKDTQKIVFTDSPDLEYQIFPNSISEIDKDRPYVIVDKSIDLSNKKSVNGELINKTNEDLEIEQQQALEYLDAQHKKQRKTALMSFDLTIFTDTTLSIEKQNDIKRVRQEWKDMTIQPSYPTQFIEPSLDSNIWST